MTLTKDIVRILFRRGTTAEIATEQADTGITKYAAEPRWNTDTKKLYVHDGTNNLPVGGIKAIRIITTTDTPTVSDEVIICNSTTAFTVNLPAATATGQKYLIKNINTGTVTVDGATTDTIDGELTQSLYQYDAIQIVDYAAGAWIIVQEKQ